jgi:hypothetical protein
MKKLKDISLEELNQKYTDLISPSNFIYVFESEDEFKEWARLGSTEDLEWAIKEFEKDELYKYCNILKQIKDENRSI